MANVPANVNPNTVNNAAPPSASAPKNPEEQAFRNLADQAKEMLDKTIKNIIKPPIA